MQRSLRRWKWSTLSVAAVVAVFAVSSVAFAQSGSVRTQRGVRVTQFGGERVDMARDVAVDARGVAYVVGRSDSRWSGLDDICPRAPQDECSAGFVTALSPERRVLWSRRVGGTGWGGAYEVVHDPERRRVVVAGWWQPSEGPGFQRGLFLTALDEEGRTIWKKTFDADGSRSDGIDIVDMKLAPDGGVVVLGSTRNDFDGHEHIGGHINGACNGDDVFVVKVGPDGREMWSHLWGVPDRGEWTLRNDYAGALAIGPDGTVWIAGTSDGDILKHRKRPRKAFLLRLRADGSRPTVIYTPADTSPTPVALAPAPGGGVYRLGVQTGGDARPLDARLGKADLILEELSKSGKVRWSVRFGTPRREYGGELLVGPAGDLFVLGVEGLHDKPDVLVYRLSAQGEMRWRRALRTEKPDEAYGMALDVKRGLAVVAGSTTGRLFGNRNQGVATSQYSPYDAFLADVPMDGRLAGEPPRH